MLNEPEPPEPQLVLFVTAFLLLIAACILLWCLRGQRKQTSTRDVQPIILAITTAVAPYKVKQTAALKYAQSLSKLYNTRPVLERVYLGTHIQTRNFVIPDLCQVPSPRLTASTGSSNISGRSRSATHSSNSGGGGGGSGILSSNLNSNGSSEIEVGVEVAPRFFPADGSFAVLGEERSRKFRECSLPLALSASRRAIQLANVQYADVGKVIVVTSTALAGHPLDADLIKQLGLAVTTDRTMVTYMGCGAAIGGIRMAGAYAQANPGKHALVVCCELPSLHSTYTDTVNDVILHALFADGCGAVVVTAMPLKLAPAGSFAVQHVGGLVAPDTEDGIQIHLGTSGVSCSLSKRLSGYIERYLPDYINGILKKEGLMSGDIAYWAIHPGGHRIVEDAAAVLGLRPSQLDDSAQVLREGGNMLSATLLFVLEKVLQRHAKEGGGDNSSSSSTSSSSNGGGGGRLQQQPVVEGSARLGLGARAREQRAEKEKRPKYVMAIGFSPGMTMQSLLLRAL